MKNRRSAFLNFLPVALCLLFLGNQVAEAEEKQENNICFRWAFGAMVGPENDRRLVAITRDTTLKTGDRLKLFVELKKECFIYLIYKSGQDELHMLFPEKINQFNTDYSVLKKYYIPQGDMWFELDENTGLETFYLLASVNRLTGLESMMVKYSRADKAEKKKLVKEIVAEIRKIKRRHRTFTSPAERPVSIGGTVRGIDKDKKKGSPDIDPIAEDVSTRDFYARTFTIDHR